MRTKTILTLALAGTLAQSGLAQSTNKWETSAAAGLTLTSGNSETFLATVSLDTKRKWVKDEAAAGMAFGYGESQVEVTDSLGATITDNEKTTQFGTAYVQYNRLFNERLYGGIRLDAGYDTIAGVDYRIKASPLLGYYFIKNEKTTLAGEIGPTFIMEELEGDDPNSYVAARFAERFEHKLTKTTRIWQSAEYLPDISDWQNKYLIVAELGIEAAITPKLSLRTVVQDSYDSQPASGREHNDIRLIAGIAYKF